MKSIIEIFYLLFIVINSIDDKIDIDPFKFLGIPDFRLDLN